MCCDYMESHEEELAPFLDEDIEGSFQDYVKRMRSHGEWADNMVIAVMSKILERDVRILHMAAHQTWVIGKNGESAPPLLVSFYQIANLGHYNAIFNIYNEEINAADVVGDSDNESECPETSEFIPHAFRQRLRSGTTSVR